MKHKYKIGVWGQYGDGGKIADGQAVRTTIITNELKMRYGNENVICANTNGWKQKKISFFFQCVSLVRNSEKVLILPADNGFKIFVPILLFINVFFRRDLYYIVIGGFLPSLLNKKPIYKRFVNKFKAVFVQTENIKNDLECLGIQHIHILSNPKRLNTISKDELHLNRCEQIKVCVFSRIYADKGIEDAIAAVKYVNDVLGDIKVTLDLYGLVPETYKERLAFLLDKYSDFLDYKGIVDYDKTVETLKEYFVMLFPTYYHGEGFPGNVVDAYNSALPIIATDWLYNKDVIKNNYNGILVPIKNPEAIAEALLFLYHNRDIAYDYSLNNLKESEKYKPDKVLEEFYLVLEESNEKI